MPTFMSIGQSLISDNATGVSRIAEVIAINDLVLISYNMLTGI
jgi:hypothetical protein